MRVVCRNDIGERESPIQQFVHASARPVDQRSIKSAGHSMPPKAASARAALSRAARQAVSIPYLPIPGHARARALALHESKQAAAMRSRPWASTSTEVHPRSASSASGLPIEP